MATKMKALGLSVVIVFMLLKTSHSQFPKCRKTEQNYGCPFQQLSSEKNSSCKAIEYEEPGFAFYFKPGSDFRELTIGITKVDFLRGIKELPFYVFVKKYLLNPDKWYNIHFSSAETEWYGKVITYYLYIDGYRKESFQLKLAQDSKFIVIIRGSSFHSGSSCNPGFFPPPRTTNPPPPPPTTNPPPPPPISPAPWWVFVIVGVVIGIVMMIIIAVIITAVVKSKSPPSVPWPALTPPLPPPQQFQESDDPANHTYMTMQCHGHHHPHPPPQNICDLDDPANHIYEEPEDVNIEDHIYETVEDVGGPITFVDGSGGQSIAYHVATPERCNIPNQPNNA